MIINVRGTSGSGKSHLVRHIMGLYPEKEAVRLPGRKQPWYYICRNGQGTPELAVIGHYETACGGCDTVPSLDKVYELVQEHAAAGRHVMFEGLLLTNEVTRTKALPDCRVIFLDISVEECLRSVNARRRARGEMTDVNPANTTSKWHQARRAEERFRELPDQPVQTFRASRDQAQVLIEEMLDL
jgi:thymidylate kinase